jgi:hypothetical protein
MDALTTEKGLPVSIGEPFFYRRGLNPNILLEAHWVLNPEYGMVIACAQFEETEVQGNA